MRHLRLLYMLPLFLLCIATGCRQRRHNREEKKIEKERAQDQAVTADLSEAVKATDEAGWDSATAFRQFYDHANTVLAADSKQLAAFKLRVSKGRKKVPLLYRTRIRHLEQRTLELGQRLAAYNHTGKATWDDFTRLYSYDLLQLGKDIDRLTKNKNEKSNPRHK